MNYFVLRYSEKLAKGRVIDVKIDILKYIEDNYSEFSKGQKQIASFITNHFDKAAYMTAARLGQEVGVSESTVVRFVIELGFEG